MIHEFSEDMLNLPLEKFILTFDDGLYTQYKYLSELKKIPTKKIFFISTGIVRPDDVEPSDTFIKCELAHYKAFKGNFENYMSWEEIMEIHLTPNCEIGGHGHAHLRLEDIKSTRDRYNAIDKDCKEMFKQFKANGINISKFCYPYNYEDHLLKGVLQRKGIKEFFGDERTAIEYIQLKDKQ